jgi:hypothetical protein
MQYSEALVATRFDLRKSMGFHRLQQPWTRPRPSATLELMPRPLKPLNPYGSWSALFGATVQRLRHGPDARARMTQAELGRRIGFANSTVSAIERAQLRPDEQFVEGCERERPAGGLLRMMYRFVVVEWADAERLGLKVPGVINAPVPADLISDPSQALDAASFETSPMAWWPP